MSDYFQRADLDDILENILLSQPLKELSQMQLVNRHWRRIMSSQQFEELVLGKEALLLVCNTDRFLGVVHTEKLLMESRPIFTPRMFRDIKLPVVNIFGSCGGLICLVDSTKTLFVLNPRNLECRNLMIGDGIPSGAYGFGWLTRGHVLIKMADRPFRHVLRMSVFDLKLNEWSQLRTDFWRYDWSFHLVSRAPGVFIDGSYCWLGRVNQESRAFDSIIMYNENEDEFDYIELSECMTSLKLQLGTPAEGRAGMWEIGRCTSIWLMHPDTKQFERIPIHGYASALVCQPLYLCQEKEFAVMLVQNQRVSLYNLKSHHIVKDIKHFPAHTHLHCMFQPICFKDSFVSPLQ